ncbi:MAG: ATP-binding protein [Candidatus Dormibacteraceae bacterium]
MNSGFVSRRHELAELSELLDRIRESGDGQILTVRGRRRVGKSRLVQEWLLASKTPNVYFEASRLTDRQELTAFTAAIASSNLPLADEAIGIGSFGSWEAALAFVIRRAKRSNPPVVVIDEFPYLRRGNDNIETLFQHAYDTLIDHRAPILVILVGSDLSLMERMHRYSEPLYGRVSEMIIRPMTPADTGEMLNLKPADALDAHLITGGIPELVEAWRPGEAPETFLARELRPVTRLVVGAERVLAAEFPHDVPAREVLTAIAGGMSTYSSIANRVGIPQTTLARTLKILTEDKRVVTASQPMSVPRDARLKHYVIADTYLRFWLELVEPALPELERGRNELVLSRILARWSTYRGTAIEPIIREAITRILPDERFGDALYCGSWWRRDQVTDVDLVGIDREAKPRQVSFVGSIKWRERLPFDDHDLAEAHRWRELVPGTDRLTRLVGVSRSVFDAPGLDVRIGPDEIVQAFR